MTVTEAETAFGISRRTLERWARARRLRMYKYDLDRHTYVRRSEVAPLLRERAKTGRPGGWLLHGENGRE
jgi:predicted site-specific integrase-resolvase